MIDDPCFPNLHILVLSLFQTFFFKILRKNNDIFFLQKNVCLVVVFLNVGTDPRTFQLDNLDALDSKGIVYSM